MAIAGNLNAAPETKGLMILESGAINFTWYLEGEIMPDGRMRVYTHFRRHNTRDQHPPKTDGRYAVVEGAGRIVTHVKVYAGLDSEPTVYEVCNPRYIFDYN